MLKEIFTGIKYLYAHDRAVRAIVNSNIFGKPLGGNFKFTLLKPDIRGVYLRIIANFHYARLLKIKGVNCYDNNGFFFFDNRRHLFNTVKLIAPFAIILKIMAIGNAAVLSGKPLAIMNR